MIVGRPDLIEACRMAAAQMLVLDELLKREKEELAGFITALEIFVNEEPGRLV
mgnify:CR=1 FL=1